MNKSNYIIVFFIFFCFDLCAQSFIQENPINKKITIDGYFGDKYKLWDKASNLDKCEYLQLLADCTQKEMKSSKNRALQTFNEIAKLARKTNCEIKQIQWLDSGNKKLHL